MVLYVIGPTFEREAVIENYTSLIWTKRARACGDFELYMRADAETYQALYGGEFPRFLVREQDVLGPLTYRNVMRIDGLGSRAQFMSAAESGDWMTVTGQDLKSLLYQRIIPRQTIAKATLPNICTALLNANVISPTDANRTIAGFTRGADDLVTADISTTQVERQWTGDNLGAAIQELLDTRNLMFDVEITNGRYEFTIYEGRDRSLDQNTNDFVVFSYDFENLLNSNYAKGRTEDYANASYIGGEGEGTARTIVSAETAGAQGADRYELWVDARNSSSNDGEISASEYNAQLRQEGREAYLETQEKSAPTFDAEIDLTVSPFHLGRDFSLNDVVQIDGFWATSAARVTEIIESESDKGPRVVAKLTQFAIEPEPVPTLRSLNTEYDAPILTETDRVIVTEDAEGLRSGGSDTGVRISELQAASPNDDFYLPFADTDVTTYKVKYSDIKAEFPEEPSAISNLEIDIIVQLADET